MSRHRLAFVAVTVIVIASVYAAFAVAYARLSVTADPLDEGRPRVEISETVRRLNGVRVGERCEASFLVRNGGERRLVLNAIQSECECTRIQDPEIIVTPGRTVPLKVTLQAPGIAGAYDLSAKYSTNDVAHPVLTLMLRVEIEPSLPEREAKPELDRVPQSSDRRCY